MWPDSDQGSLTQSPCSHSSVYSSIMRAWTKWLFFKCVPRSLKAAGQRAWLSVWGEGAGSAPRAPASIREAPFFLVLFLKLFYKLESHSRILWEKEVHCSETKTKQSPKPKWSHSLFLKSLLPLPCFPEPAGKLSLPTFEHVGAGWATSYNNWMTTCPEARSHGAKASLKTCWR